MDVLPYVMLSRGGLWIQEVVHWIVPLPGTGNPSGSTEARTIVALLIVMLNRESVNATVAPGLTAALRGS